MCQKLSNLMEIWRSSDKNKLGHFWHTLYIIRQKWGPAPLGPGLPFGVTTESSAMIYQKIESVQ